ncbi:hypothetical protein OZX61_09085 [Acinetobacter sp. ESL0695]|uniref:hypothetical protein n=1 Tax=Acinetobacter sp. ESL0695 TaxID=2983215 RepID=UPI0023F137C9|nr:hypothetical protein [Acinetobacter sp. ESL0695]WEV48424.1 hypothetical protein OZX61_09085 [Acinetobacter sp. ESL0695]
MFKLNKTVLVLVSAMLLGNTAAFAEDMIDYDGKPEQKVIYPVNGKSGFVFNKLSQAFKTSTTGYNTIIVDSSTMPSSAQISQIKSYLDQGITVIIDAKAGMGTAQAVAQKVAGFSINSEAIMIKKSTDSNGGYDVTPVSSNVYGVQASLDDSGEKVSNTVDAVFGL